MNDQITRIVSPTFGCDPEIFLARGNQIIGAERVIPAEGLDTPSADWNYALTEKRKGIVLDGVQVELNPKAHSCRGLVGNEIAAAFRTLKAHLAKMDGITASFRQVVEVDAKELEALSEKAKALGCAPSRNIYNTQATVGIDGATNGQRSAGGHIHLGLSDASLMEARERLVVLMDIFVGNTAVLLDRDPLNAQRRKNYGRAGEHRLPSHGMEYRTLSNFWLRAWPLTSGMFGISRFVCNVLAHSLPAHSYMSFKKAESKILGMVDVEAVQRAINTNDLVLAQANYKVVRDYLAAHTKGWDKTGIHAGNLEAFDFYAQKVAEHGLEYWHPADPMKHWTEDFKHMTGHTSMMAGNQIGWESFLTRFVEPEMTTGKRVVTA